MSASSNSPAETAARCAHFGTCGGCSSQNLPYEEQLKAKLARVGALIGAFVTPSEIIPSPDIWFYRNKMEFSFADVYPPREGAPPLTLGLKPKGKWFEVIDLQHCFLLSQETAALLAAVRRWAIENKVPPYINKRNTGALRHLVVREAKNTGERMVLLVTAPHQIPTESFVEAVRRAYPASTVLWGVNGKVSDTAISDKIGPLYGPGHITEELRFPGQTVKYRISPQAFFQTNTLGTQRLYGVLRDWIKELAPRAALDLYCGGGGIGLSLSGVVEKVYGVELNAAAVADAKANAALNGIANADFFAGTVESLLPSMLALGADAAVIDPPRAGMHPSALPALLQGGPKDLIYVSCNPEALARDLGKLSEKYQAKRAVVVDLFPHTDHVETVVQLARR
jgi:23S rRNA (uracil1939-C5)-methyltransferase